MAKKPEQRTTWKGRKNKTRQDMMPRDQRERVHNWERVINYSQKHKPTSSEDWIKFRTSN